MASGSTSSRATVKALMFAQKRSSGSPRRRASRPVRRDRSPLTAGLRVLQPVEAGVERVGEHGRVAEPAGHRDGIGAEPLRSG